MLRFLLLLYTLSVFSGQICAFVPALQQIPAASLSAAPEGALSDIVIPTVFNLSDWVDNDPNAKEEDPRVWVKQTDCLSFKPLCFCTSQGYYVNLLKFTGGGVLGRHRHSSPVHALTLKGSWGSLLYVSEETGEVTGFDDVFSKLEKARDWYEECGLGREYADRLIR
eukprot:scaffold3280_cov177-Skeletonema_marinoi.AAC.5